MIYLLTASGHISSDVHITHLKDQQNQYGIGSLTEIYKEPIEGYKVDYVIFVQGGNTVVPKKLLQCIQSVIRERNPDTGIPICKFGNQVAYLYLHMYFYALFFYVYFTLVLNNQL